MRPTSDATVFAAIAESLVQNLQGRASEKTRQRRFKKIFGVGPETCSRLWALILPLVPPTSNPVHLLWSLFFLKQYGLEKVNAAFARCNEKTYRKWCWIVIKALSELELVSSEMGCVCCSYCEIKQTVLQT
jgi:hypothetical protein